MFPLDKIHIWHGSLSLHGTWELLAMHVHGDLSGHSADLSIDVPIANPSCADPQVEF